MQFETLFGADDEPRDCRQEELAVVLVYDPTLDSTPIRELRPPVLPLRRFERRHLALHAGVLSIGDSDDVVDIDGRAHDSGGVAFV